MKNISRNIKLKSKKLKITLIPLIFFLIAILNAQFLFSPTMFANNRNNMLEDITHEDWSLDLSNGEDFLFQGIEDSLIINDTGNLYDLNQDISASNQEEINLTYYLDDVHNWQTSKIQIEVNNIQDTRIWINNSDFSPIIVFRVNETHASPHNYQSNRGRSQTLDPITHSGAIAMRAHFTNISFEDGYDYMFIEDQNDTVYYTDTGYKLDFFSPWIRGDTLNCYFQTDYAIVDWGYEIDYYEFVNSSSNYEINSNDWIFNSTTITNTNYGSGNIDGVDSMFVALNSELSADGDYWDAIYYDNSFSEIYQNITIPRGQVIDAYISFDFYAQYAMDSNENYIYFQINNKKIYSKGLADINELGKNIWHSTGLINMALWSNTSNIFDSILENNAFNISVGIMSGATIIYSGFEDQYQQVFWFDNVSLILTTLANSSQTDINLEFNTNPLIENTQWGSSYLNLTGNWVDNPVILTVTTSSPSLNFELSTTLYGFHETVSKVGQTTQGGVSYQILKNGSVIWQFTHNFYMPSQYADFEFEISKPKNWRFISALDPTFGSIQFEGGDIGDSFLRINKTNAMYPGWWTFSATSPNYINDENTKLFKDGEWVESTFRTGDSTKVKTQINYSNEIPKNLDITNVNLTVYFPNGTIWFQESKTPFSNGTVIFNDINFTPENSVGGIYNYTLFWSNGTALGGLKSNFIVIHDSYLTILKPDDAKLDNQTGATVGDIIPLRIFLRDAETGQSIPNAVISYNWTSGTTYLTDAALGIYEGILDTSDLGGYGLYNIVISSNKIGFIDSNLTLLINLGENTNLQRLDSDSEIVIHENSTIRFLYYSEFDDEGIPNALVTVNITNPIYYTIHDLSEGIYSIEFNTVFYNHTGTYRLIFEFSAIGYEPQLHIYQFKLIDPPPNPQGPNIWVWVILFASLGVGAIFAALSLRSYVLLPRRRKKESELLAKTQRFKDLKNIQAIVITHKLSGIPIFSKSYSILEKHKKELFSGFIQAITTIGEEFVEKEKAEAEKAYGIEKMIELDFKQFYCLIADIGEIRTVFILKEKSSERLKNQISNLVLALNLKLSKELENWDGALDDFEIMVPQIINEYFELYYKESFKLASDINLIKMKKEKKLTKMEMRVVNVLQSMAKDNLIADINSTVELVHEENKDLIIEAIESLIKQKIIIPLDN